VVVFRNKSKIKKRRRKTGTQPAGMNAREKSENYILCWLNAITVLSDCFWRFFVFCPPVASGRTLPDCASPRTHCEHPIAPSNFDFAQRTRMLLQASSC
jgi:hypothetical protein